MRPPSKPFTDTARLLDMKLVSDAARNPIRLEITLDSGGMNQQKISDSLVPRDEDQEAFAKATKSLRNSVFKHLPDDAWSQAWSTGSAALSVNRDLRLIARLDHNLFSTKPLTIPAANDIANPMMAMSSPQAPAMSPVMKSDEDARIYYEKLFQKTIDDLKRKGVVPITRHTTPQLRRGFFGSEKLSAAPLDSAFDAFLEALTEHNIVPDVNRLLILSASTQERKKDNKTRYCPVVTVMIDPKAGPEVSKLLMNKLLDKDMLKQKLASVWKDFTVWSGNYQAVPGGVTHYDTNTAVAFTLEDVLHFQNTGRPALIQKNEAQRMAEMLCSGMQRQTGISCAVSRNP